MVANHTTRLDSEAQYIDVELVHVSVKKLRKLSSTKVDQYMRDYERGDDFPPINVRDCGGFYTIRDGRHRFQAQLAAGYKMIEVIIQGGSHESRP